MPDRLSVPNRLHYFAMRFFDELKRRNVVRVAIAYLAISWVVLQIVDVVAPILEIPDWVAKVVLLVLAVGLVLALPVAWFFELTPEGLKRDEEVDRSQVDSTTTRAWTSRLIIVFLSTAVLLLFFDRLTGLSRSLSVGGNDPFVSIVVLPLDDVMKDEEQTYFVQGMHAALITELTKIDALNVISRTSSLKYQDSDLSLPEIARELGVDMVIEGSVLHANQQVRITTQLIDAGSDRHLWAESFDRELTDILLLYSEVAREIARHVEVEVTPADKARLASYRQVNPEAYNKYLEARYLLNTWSPEEMLQGLDLMREAVDLDPDSAMMHAGLAIGLQYAAWFNFLEAVDVVEEARHSAIKAIELDPESSHAWTAQGAVSYYLEFDIPSGISALEKALELQPGDQQALIHYGWLLGEAGQFEQSFSLAKQSIELDPFSAVAHGALAQAQLLSGDYEESLKTYKKVLELDRRDPSAYFFLTWPNLQLGNIQKSIEFARISVELSGGAHLYRAGLAYVLAITSQLEEAREILFDLKAQDAPPILLAEIHLGLGELETALDYLELAFEARNATLMYIYKSPRFDPLRGHPRFEALVDRMGWRSLSFD